MDKVKVLRHLTGADFFPLLSNGELKLYLLLLVNASEFDTVEKVNLKQIEKANGENALFIRTQGYDGFLRETRTYNHGTDYRTSSGEGFIEIQA